MIALNVRPKDLEKALLPLQAFPTQVRGALWQSVKRSLTTLKKEVANEIKAVSYLEKGIINKAITKPQMYCKNTRGNKQWSNDTIMGSIRISTRPLLADKYKFIPNRITARKKRRSAQWSLSAFKWGPNERARTRDETSQLSKGFIIRGQDSRKLRFVHRRKNSKKKNNFYFATGPAVQYFSTFKQVQKLGFSHAKERFEKTLAHEVEYRLGKIGRKR
ncbi:MAG: hypothetical protein R3Y11_01640 [Pseudomonadota bacterium]